MKRLFHLFSKESSVRGASMLLIVTLTLSNILGLFRDRFLTKNILTRDLDIYYSSFRIPDLIFNFLILGAISSAFIPIFSDYIAKKKEKDGFAVTSSLMNLAALTMILSAILLAIFMPYLMPLIVPKFDQERLALAVKYSRLLMLTPIFFSLSYISSGVLNSFKHFFAYSLAPLFYNLTIILGAAFLAPKYGLIAVIYCVIAGSLVHFLVQLPSLIKLGFRYTFSFDFKNPAIKRIVRLMIPRTVGMGVNQIMLIAFTAVASSLAAGSIAAFELSNNIQTMPIVVFGTSFATAVFPTLTAKISENDSESFSFYLNRAMRAMAYLLIPSSICFILMRAQIVRLILGSGKFTWDDTKMTAMALGLFSISLIAQGLVGLLARAFYALKNTRTPMFISIATAALAIVCAYPLAKNLGVAGLALAFTIGSFFNAFVLLWTLRRKYKSILNRETVFSYIKIILISLIMGFFVWATLHIMVNYVDMNRFFGVLTQVAVAIAVGFISYAALSYLLNCEEMRWAITRKINGKQP